MPSLLTAAALAASAFAVAPDASADIDRHDYTYEYAATIESDVDYNIARTGTNHLGTWSSQLDDEFSVRTEIPRVTFLAGMPSHNNPAYSTATATRGHLRMIPAGSGQEYTCSGTEIQDVAGGALMGVLDANVMQFKVRVLDGLTRRLPQCSAGLPFYMQRYDVLGAPMGEGYFDTTISFPGARLGSDHAQTLHGEVSGARCPGYDEDTSVCLLTWDATITFKLVRSEKTPVPGPLTEADLPTPGVPTPMPPRPVPPTKAYTVDAGRLDLAAGTATVPVTCAAACTGVATAALPSARARAAATKAKAGRPLATRRFRAAAGRTAKVVLRIPKAKRAAVRRARALRVTLVVTQGGRPTTEAVTLRPRR